METALADTRVVPISGPRQAGKTTLARQFADDNRPYMMTLGDAGTLSAAIGIEVKASATVKSDDFRGLRQLQEAVGDRFIRGLVLHDHDRVTPFGERLYAAPLSVLWSM